VNPYSTAQQAYTESSVLTATREQLVVMLYDGASRFLNQATVAMRSGNVEVSSNRLHRAVAIIDELNVSLDMDQGEISAQLRSIYLFCKRHLVDARIERDTAKIDDVVRLLGELRQAWQTIAARAATAPEAQAV
jgi:flagellar secretion chaperone FliS